MFDYLTKLIVNQYGILSIFILIRLPISVTYKRFDSSLQTITNYEKTPQGK